MPVLSFPDIYIMQIVEVKKGICGLGFNVDNLVW